MGVTLHGTDGTASVASFADCSSALRARIPSGVENSTTTAVLCMAHGQGGAEIAGERRTALTCNHEAPIVFHPTQDPIHSTQDPDTNTELAHTLGRNHGQENAVFHTTGAGWWNQDEVSGTLRAREQESHEHLAISVSLRGREGGATAELGDEVAGCLRASSGGGDKPHVLAPVCATSEVTHTLKADGFDGSEDGTGRGQPIVAFAQNSRDEVRLVNGDGSIVGALAAQPGMKQTSYVAQEMAVRRLTPRECERLQGFPDNWTLVEWYECCGSRFHVSLGKHGCPNCEGDKEARIKTAADGPRYKALGNSMAVPCMAWIGSRIKMVLEWRATA